jgi:periplasmic divalent cation tolerance protein
MKAGGQERIVLVTCGNAEEARRIARAAVTKRLAACVNILPAPVQSIYRWKGKVQEAREVLMVIKTTAKRLPELEREVGRLHSYDVPEFIAVRLAAGSRNYLRWIADSVKT